MKTTRVTVRFPRGLHARPAAGVVQLFKRFQCRVRLRAGNRAANARNILSILMLAASFNTQLEIQASGTDEESALRAAEIFFQNDDEAALTKKGNQPSPGDRTQETY
jgi:phosphotransferase system HPr (HPr) family protein